MVQSFVLYFPTVHAKGMILIERAFDTAPSSTLGQTLCLVSCSSQSSPLAGRNQTGPGGN